MVCSKGAGVILWLYICSVSIILRVSFLHFNNLAPPYSQEFMPSRDSVGMHELWKTNWIRSGIHHRQCSEHSAKPTTQTLTESAADPSSKSESNRSKQGTDPTAVMHHQPLKVWVLWLLRSLAEHFVARLHCRIRHIIIHIHAAFSQDNARQRITAPSERGRATHRSLPSAHGCPLLKCSCSSPRSRLERRSMRVRAWPRDERRLRVASRCAAKPSAGKLQTRSRAAGSRARPPFPKRTTTSVSTIPPASCLACEVSTPSVPALSPLVMHDPCEQSTEARPAPARRSRDW